MLSFYKREKRQPSPGLPIQKIQEPYCTTKAIRAGDENRARIIDMTIHESVHELMNAAFREHGGEGETDSYVLRPHGSDEADWVDEMDAMGEDFADIC